MKRADETADSAPETAVEALARAGRHTRRSAVEMVLALRATLDAASLATRGTPARGPGPLGSLSALLEGLAADLGGDGEVSESLLAAVADALDAEIGRWEERARGDRDARAVLRAFLGLRELLWELGVRPTATPDSRHEPPSARPARTRPRRARVQRVPVEG